MEIFFVRHGQSTANAKGLWQGQLEFPLSPLGKEQARLAGEALAATGTFSGVYTSPLQRAAQTAGIISEALESSGNFRGEVVTFEGLTERHGGVLQGRSLEQASYEEPELIEKFRSLPAEEAWSFVGAETNETLVSRFGSAVEEIRKIHSAEQSPRAVVVAHGGVLRAYLKKTFGEDALPEGARVPNAALTHVAWRDSSGEPELLALADTAHLDGL
jgi:broad specificity phosphatase PhoE